MRNYLFTFLRQISAAHRGSRRQEARASFSSRSRGLHSKGNAGFSMIELVLSIGVMSFAFVGLLALLPAGMTTFGKAIDTSVGLQISQRVVDEALLSDFNTFLSKAQAVRYFDDQANELPDTKGAIYYVNVRTQAAVTVPGATDANSNLAEITGQIATNPGGKKLAVDSSNLWPADPSVPMTAYSTFMAGYCAQ